MRTKKFFNYLASAIIVCCATCMITSCQGLMDAIVGTEDKPVTTPTTPTNDAAQLKQGIWTEYDTALGDLDEYTEEQLAGIPAVGMILKGDKASFFTYTAEGADNLVEGKITYNKSANTGTITFPTIAGSAISGLTVNFTMSSDEQMDFNFTYGGQTTTGTCAWLCENMDNWGTEIDDPEWKELMAYYDAISAEGPDASIDWSGSATVTVEDVDDKGKTVEKEVTVTDLDKPLVWNEGASTRAGTRIAITSVVSMGLNILGSLFEEDPTEAINAKLDAVLGKLDEVLANQQKMMIKLDEINGRLIEIAQRMKKQEIVNIFNNRNKEFYNKLKVQNIQYFDEAYQKYKANKNDPELGDIAKEWVGKNEEFISLTWEYIEYLTTVQHTDYGTGMDRIYDGLVFDKYPWEHIGIDDRKSYRAYDMFMITKCLFMISLYSTYGGLDKYEQKGLYNSYKSYKPQLKQFCEFKVTNPDEFRVCQIPGAHFVMHKELQKYNYCGKNNEAPNPKLYQPEVVYRPEWHEAGSIKIENPKELLSKLISKNEAIAIYDYYNAAVYPNQKNIWWYNMLVEGNDLAGGAAYAKKPTVNELCLILYDEINGMVERYSRPTMHPLLKNDKNNMWSSMGIVNIGNTWTWTNYYNLEYYAAIIEKRY